MPPYKADTCWFVKYSSAIALDDAGIARVSYLHKTGKIPICISWHIKQPTKGSTDLSVRSVVLLNPVREGGFADGEVEYHRDIANIKIVAGGFSIARAIPVIGGTEPNR